MIHQFARRLLIGISGIFLTVSVLAQGNDFWEHEGPILLQNITVIDGRGTEAVPMRDILVVDGKIAKIAVTTMIANIPPGTKVIDGEGMTVLPGLLDMHTHQWCGLLEVESRCRSV
jgi:imidazolonepropionase-like amidohydrolase